MPARSPSLVCAVVFACACVAAPGRARAQTDAPASGQRVHRCAGPHGEAVFTWLPCGASGQSGVSLAPPTPPPGAPYVAQACPGTLDDLRARVASAVDRHDANAVAGLLRWRGIGGGEAARRLRELRDLVRLPLLGIESDNGLHVRTGSHLDSGVRAQAFGVDFDGSCYWLSW